jgi:hypothetical protein
MTKVVDVEVVNQLKAEIAALRNEVASQKTELNALRNGQASVNNFRALPNQPTTRRGLLKALAVGAVTAGALGVTLGYDSGETIFAQTVDPNRPLVAPAPIKPGFFYKSVSGLDFLPESSSTPFDKTTGLGGIKKGADSNQVYVAQVDIPQGAVIEEVVWYFVKPVGNDFSFALNRYDYPDQSVIQLFSNNTSALSGSTNVRSLVTTPASGITIGQRTVDNSAYNYNLVAQVPYIFGQDYFLQGARVGYSMPYGTGIYFLNTPIRVAATNNAGGTLPLLTASGNVSNIGNGQVVQVTGVIVGGAVVPQGAKAIMGSLTSVGAITSGNLRIFPDGAPAPTVNSLNIPLNFATNNGFNHTTSVIVGLSAEGKVRIVYNNSTAGSTCGFNLDIVGYVM